MKLLIANRGEIAVRIAHAAADLDIETVAVYSEDDANSLHIRKTDHAHALTGAGARPYLDIDQLTAAAKSHDCDAVHPGYGFLSENPDFASRLAEENITFVGPPPAALELFGDKARARSLAAELGVPIIEGISRAATLDEVRIFHESLLPGTQVLVKAVSGGGGRGMRVASTPDELEAAYERAQSEANASFGSPQVFVERYIQKARHVEVQIAADSTGEVLYLGDRDCTLQRRHQKIIEIAPAPSLDEPLRRSLADCALALAKAAEYQSLGTFEFLIEGSRFFFIEANARLQVEHTVTEEVTGIDLVELQLWIAQGGSVDGFYPAQKGIAVQARVNMETMTADGSAKPSGGELTAFEPPSGRGLRVDTFGYSGYRTSPNFDSLLAKVISHFPSDDLAAALKRTSRALSDFRIEGVATNIDFLRTLLAHDSLIDWDVHTRFVDENAADLIAATSPEGRYFTSTPERKTAPGMAGAKVDESDPLAVLDYGKSATSTAPPPDAPDGLTALRAPMQGTIVSLAVSPGDEVHAKTLILVMEAMKMEHEIRSTVSGVLRELNIAVGDTVYEDHPLAYIEEQDLASTDDEAEEEIDLDHIRPDLAEVHARHASTLDEARPDAVAKRRKTQQRTTRESIEQLCDPGSFVEYGNLVLTPGTGLPKDEVIKKFPTDGMVTGVGTVNGADFPGERSRVMVCAYDYTVLAGTQGVLNHIKTDRMLELARDWKRPLVLFAEGGGGRAGTGGKRKGGESTTSAGQGRTDDMYRPLDTPTFATMGTLSGLVPLIGITSRYCFAGNASLLGCCDVIIATENSSIGMGGPALIEGGGLGVFRPEEVGPMSVQVPNGVVDIAVQDEVEAVEVAKKYLSYFQGSQKKWTAADQRLLRRVVPENRLRVYDIRELIRILADTDSVLELRPKFGLGMVTALARIEGRPVGILANNPQFLSGAIDTPGSDKAARFLQLCDSFDIPVVVLCDTPGMMVGPEIERTALVRHCSRLFVTGSNMTVPIVTMVIRKAYGLGAQAMAGGHMKVPMFTVAWPTAEQGGMGLEGQMKLGFRNELAAIDDPSARTARYNELVAAAYERGKAINAGAAFAFDDVIDPADSRRWIGKMLASVPATPPRTGKKRPYIDTW